MPVTRFFLCSKFQFSSFPLPIKADTLDNTGLLCYNYTN